MKKIIFALIAIFLATASYALTKSNDELMCYEPTPQFPGGDKACLEFVRQNIRYSDEMIKNGIKGCVVVGFRVEKDGNLSNLRIKKTADARLNDEALRVVRSMPKWIPAKDKGQPVSMRYTIPIQFSLKK